MQSWQKVGNYTSLDSDSLEWIEIHHSESEFKWDVSLKIDTRDSHLLDLVLHWIKIRYDSHVSSTINALPNNPRRGEENLIMQMQFI